MHNFLLTPLLNLAPNHHKLGQIQQVTDREFLEFAHDPAYAAFNRAGGILDRFDNMHRQGYISHCRSPLV
jgi:hypothetical protein